MQSVEELQKQRKAEEEARARRKAREKGGAGRNKRDRCRNFSKVRTPCVCTGSACTRVTADEQDNSTLCIYSAGTVVTRVA